MRRVFGLGWSLKRVAQWIGMTGRWSSHFLEELAVFTRFPSRICLRNTLRCTRCCDCYCRDQRICQRNVRLFIQLLFELGGLSLVATACSGLREHGSSFYRPSRCLVSSLGQRVFRRALRWGSRCCSRILSGRECLKCGGSLLCWKLTSSPSCSVSRTLAPGKSSASSAKLRSLRFHLSHLAGKKANRRWVCAESWSIAANLA